MKEIFLTRDRVALVDDSKYQVLSDYQWCYMTVGYAYNSQLGYMDRLIANAPKGMVVDHINGDPLDNRSSNLRVCTHADNIRSAKLNKRNKTGLKGASKDKQGFWVAHICYNYKRRYLGRYDTAQLAHEAYMTAAKELHGDYARAS